MKIRIVRPFVQPMAAPFAVGEEFHAPDHEAKAWIAGGLAVQVTEAPKPEYPTLTDPRTQKKSGK